MNVVPRQPTFEGVSHFAVDAERRRIFSLDERRVGFLVDWETGQTKELPALAIPEHYYMATQGPNSHVLGPSFLDVSLTTDLVVILSTEGVWIYPLDGETEWTRVAGHPTDPPAGVSFEQLLVQRTYPVALAVDKKTARHGSFPVVMSAFLRGNLVVQILGGCDEACDEKGGDLTRGHLLLNPKRARRVGVSCQTLSVLVSPM